MQQLQQ
jgi:hypothetical protein